LLKGSLALRSWWAGKGRLISGRAKPCGEQADNNLRGWCLAAGLLFLAGSCSRERGTAQAQCAGKASYRGAGRLPGEPSSFTPDSEPGEAVRNHRLGPKNHQAGRQLCRGTEQAPGAGPGLANRVTCVAGEAPAQGGRGGQTLTRGAAARLCRRKEVKTPRPGIVRPLY